jgi:hypothetical protein
MLCVNVDDMGPCGFNIFLFSSCRLDEVIFSFYAEALRD